MRTFPFGTRHATFTAVRRAKHARYTAMHDHRAGKPPDGVSHRRSTADDVDDVASFDEAQNLASICVPRDLELGSDASRALHTEFNAWKYRSVVGRLGGSQGYCYRDAALYTSKRGGRNRVTAADGKLDPANAA